MSKRTGHQGPDDMNEIAFRVVQQITGAEMPEQASSDNPKARAGHLGGLKGGVARKAALDPNERSEIARKAAQARWANRKQSDGES